MKRIASLAVAATRGEIRKLIDIGRLDKGR
jgi:hypothetical protein